MPQLSQNFRCFYIFLFVNYWFHLSVSFGFCFVFRLAWHFMFFTSFSFITSITEVTIHFDFELWFFFKVRLLFRIWLVFIISANTSYFTQLTFCSFSWRKEMLVRFIMFVVIIFFQVIQQNLPCLVLLGCNLTFKNMINLKWWRVLENFVKIFKFEIYLFTMNLCCHMLINWIFNKKLTINFWSLSFSPFPCVF